MGQMPRLLAIFNIIKGHNILIQTPLLFNGPLHHFQISNHLAEAYSILSTETSKFALSCIIKGHNSETTNIKYSNSNCY